MSHESETDKDCSRGQENEICGGCVLANFCKAGQSDEFGDKSDEACSEPYGDGDRCSRRRKAVWLMFWIPLIIIAVMMFMLVGVIGWDELASFGVVAVVLVGYYFAIKARMKGRI